MGKPLVSEAEEDDFHFEHRRLRDRQNSLEYDPDHDDYQMIVMPSSSESVDYEAKRLIKKQIYQLYHRIEGGGPWDVWDCSVQPLKAIDSIREYS